MNCTLDKSERLTSQIVIDKLFAGGNASMAVFPLRVVFMKMGVDGSDGDLERKPPVSILVSVPKKRFRHAVDRNRLKRLVREAYRLNKHILWKALEGKDYRMVLAFVCITDSLPTYKMVEKSMRKALVRIAERINANSQP
jgi:ribonuclease P protein component